MAALLLLRAMFDVVIAVCHDDFSATTENVLCARYDDITKMRYWLCARRGALLMLIRR